MNAELSEESMKAARKQFSIEYFSYQRLSFYQPYDRFYKTVLNPTVSNFWSEGRRLQNNHIYKH